MPDVVLRYPKVHLPTYRIKHNYKHRGIHKQSPLLNLDCMWIKINKAKYKIFPGCKGDVNVSMSWSHGQFRRPTCLHLPNVHFMQNRGLLYSNALNHCVLWNIFIFSTLSKTRNSVIMIASENSTLNLIRKSHPSCFFLERIVKKVFNAQYDLWMWTTIS